MSVRAGDAPRPDQTWGEWVGPFDASPVLLENTPFEALGQGLGYLEVKFDFVSKDRVASPRLQSMGVTLEGCGG